MRAIGAILVATAFSALPAEAQDRPPLGHGTKSFAKSLRSVVAKQGLTLPVDDECFAAHVPCRFPKMATLEIWMYPNADGKIEAVQINIDATKADIDRAFRAGRTICLATINVLATKPARAAAVEKAFEAAETLSPWRGQISDTNVMVKVDPIGDLGVCRVEPKAPGGAS